ncbi:MAG: C39 family peptidase [Tannerella sp.]|jgi:hypothetical protein|nr:C39 family peptidase [Tannerella sp.]
MKSFTITICAIILVSCAGKNDISYYQSLDFYAMRSEGTLTLLEKFKTYQQTTSVTCGPSCALMLLTYFGQSDGYDEMTLKALRGTSQDTTYLRHLLTVFDAAGKFDCKSTFDYEPDEITPALLLSFLKEGFPVIVGTNEWGGHWQIIIGYDTMGTETTSDDVLILADPYDRTDHTEDGYIVYPFENFYDGTWRNYYDPDFKWGLFLVARPNDPSNRK